jgi:hypothetical protein
VKVSFLASDQASVNFFCTNVRIIHGYGTLTVTRQERNFFTVSVITFSKFYNYKSVTKKLFNYRLTRLSVSTKKFPFHMPQVLTPKKLIKILKYYKIEKI